MKPAITSSIISQRRPEGDGSCRFTWTIALTPTALGKPGGPLNKVIFGGLFRDTGRYFNAA